MSSSPSVSRADAAAVVAASTRNPNATAPTQAVGPASGVSITFISSTTIAVIVFAIVEIGIAYYCFVRMTDPITTRVMTFVIYSAVSALLIFGTFFIIQGTFTTPTWSGSVTPAAGVTTNTSMIIPGSTIPVAVGTNGGNYGVQWWMFIQDWNYMFGQEKTVLTRGGAGNLNPYVFLAAVENTLDVKINLMSGASGSGGSSQPAPVGFTSSSTDDSFTCQIKNVPLQSWFAVSLSVSGRNVDIYLNGMLVRSCLLPAVPKNPSGDAGVMTNGGFSGNLAALNFYAGALNPSMAMAFYKAGPPAAAVAQTATSSATTPTQPYVVKLAVVDPTGQEINKYAL
jgi:hypothetical protein